MAFLTFNRNELSTRLERLEEWKQIAFALSVCERLFPNYVEFSKETSWGNPEIIRECLDIAWSRLSDGTIQLRSAQTAESCENAAPDTEDFRSKYTSAALDTALSTGNLMRLLGGFDSEKVLDIAEAGYETAEMFIHAGQEKASILTAEDQHQTLQHFVVQDELSRQKEDIDLLNELDGGFNKNTSLLRNKWSHQEPLCLSEQASSPN